MKILLDECVDRRFARELPGHDVLTVVEMGWAGIKNSDLLRRAETSFEVLVTVDRNLSFQQNLTSFKIAVVVLRAKTNRLADLKPFAPLVLKALAAMAPGELIFL